MYKATIDLSQISPELHEGLHRFCTGQTKDQTLLKYVNRIMQGYIPGEYKLVEWENFETWGPRIFAVVIEFNTHEDLIEWTLKYT